MLSLQTGLRMKRTNFFKLGPLDSVGCKELHNEKRDQRTLQQTKKRQQNLDNKYKQYKQLKQGTGEAGEAGIKNFPYFDIFDEVMGHRNSIHP